MNIIKNKQISNDKWHKLIEVSSYSSPFQTPKFLEFFNALKNFSGDVFAIEVEGVYKALVVLTIQKELGVKSYFSRRGIIYGGPLVIDNGHDHLEKLLNEVTSFYKRKLIYIETRNYFDYSLFNTQFQSAKFKYIPWLNFQLDTSSDIAVIKKSMSSSRLRQVKKALRNGAVWKEAESEDDVAAFYEILLDLYKKKIKKPLFSEDFFLEFYKKKTGKYLLVYFENTVIGGIVCPIMSGKAIYEFYVCGLDSEYKNQFPSIMATWAAIEYANENNIPLFDFMGAGNPNEAYGVREFKSRFGGEQVEHGRYLNILNPFLYKIGEIGLNVLSKLK